MWNMVAFLFILFLILGLIIVASMYPPTSSLSEFELKRRAAVGHENDLRAYQRIVAAPKINSLLRLIEALLLLTVICMLILSLGWVWGIIVAVIVTAVYRTIASVPLIRRWSKRVYEWCEPSFEGLVDQASWLGWVFRGPSLSPAPHSVRIGSPQELRYVVDHSHGALSDAQKRLVAGALSFSDTTVADIMTARDQIDAVKASEFLGPLVLDELHKLGHSRLPVMHGDLDHIVGILTVEELLSLGDKRSVTAEKAMDQAVTYLNRSDNLAHALDLFLQTHQHLIIVRDDEGQTAGLLTLGDVVDSLVGKRASLGR